MLWIALALLAASPADPDTDERVDKLIKELENPKNPSAWSAAKSLGDLGKDAKAAIPALRKALKAKSPDTRGHAAGALLLIDQKEADIVFPVLREVFRDKDAFLTAYTLLGTVAAQLTPTAGETVAGLIALSGEDNDLGWVFADMALGRIAKPSKEVVGALEAGLKDAKLKPRLQAARTLGRLDDARVKAVIPVLREGLKIADVNIRLQTARDLLKLDETQGKDIMAALAEGLKEKNLLARCRVASYLLELDEGQADKALPILKDGMDPKTGTAADVLREVGALLKRKSDRLKLVQPLLEQAAGAEDIALRREALRQIAGLGPVAGTAFDKLLREQSRDAKPEIALPAVEAQIQLNPEKASALVPRLIELAERRDKEARGARDIIVLMEQIRELNPKGREEDWIVSLAEQIEQRVKREPDAWHRDELLRLNSVVQLGEQGKKAKKALGILTLLLREPGSARDLVRGQAAIAVGRLGQDANLAIPVLARISKDENESLDVRAAARWAMKAIDRDKDKK